MDKKVPKRKHAGGRPRSHASGIQVGYAVKLNPVEAVIVRAVGEGSVYRGLRRLVVAYVKQAEAESVSAGLAAGGENDGRLFNSHLINTASRPVGQKARSEMSEEKTTEVWGIVELMGHVRLAGKVTEEEKFGSKMGRIDIPQGDEFITQYFGGHSVYRITFVTEAVARHVCKSTSVAPVQVWDFPKQLAEAKPEIEEPDFNDGDDHDYHNDGPLDDQ